MVAARSAAMGFNRLVDARIDALNPRTANRELPRGAMTHARSALFVVVASLVFVYAAWRLNTLCFVLSPVALAIVFWYSLAKRYTTWTQLFLGLAMAVAPVGGWLAVGGRGGLGAVAAGAGDRHVGRRLRRPVCVPGSRVRSRARPAVDSGPLRRAGVARHFARACTCVTIACLLALPLGDAAAAWLRRRASRGRALLVYEQSLVSADDLSQVKRAFDLNGYVGILYLIVLAVSIYGG